MTEKVSLAVNSRFTANNKTRVRWSLLKLKVPVTGNGSLIIVTEERVRPVKFPASAKLASVRAPTTGCQDKSCSSKEVVVIRLMLPPSEFIKKISPAFV